METKKTIGYLGFPEIFYDTLAYVIPAAFLVFGMIFSFLRSSDLVSYLPALGYSWVVDALIALLFFGSLFVVGQMLTVISFYLIWYWPCKILKVYVPFQRDYIGIKIQYPSMSLLITKRFAKCVCTRNMSFSSMILLGYYLYKGSSGMAIAAAIAIGLFTIDTHVRRKWFREFIDRVKAVPAGTKNHLTTE